CSFRRPAGSNALLGRLCASYLHSHREGCRPNTRLFDEPEQRKPRVGRALDHFLKRLTGARDRAPVLNGAEITVWGATLKVIIVLSNIGGADRTRHETVVSLKVKRVLPNYLTGGIDSPRECPLCSGIGERSVPSIH